MKPTYEELEQQLVAVVAECAGLEKRTQQLIDIISNADNDYCMCGDAMKNHAHGGCGWPTGMFDYHYNKWLESGNETPATDAYLAEVRAQGVEMLCEAAEQLMNEFSDDSYKVMVTGDLQRLASAFAAQLRQGAAL